MSQLVPHHLPSVLASAGICSHGGHLHGLRHGLDAHYELGHYYALLLPVGFLLGEEDETPTPPTDILDASQARREHVRNPEQFQHIAHDFSSLAPRERP